MQSTLIRQHHKSNREKLQEAYALIVSVRDDEYHGPSTYTWLTKAAAAIEEANRYPLNAAEEWELKQRAYADYGFGGCLGA